MATIRSLAAELGAQPYELTAFIDFGPGYDELAELDDATVAEYRAAWAAGLLATA
ncbi:hypothetical protein [Georgenia sp. MJ170]|uniref:hypothetical protein n=1 Tax=Georgenia sunbinii TaxID=3117728 RepID=UPI002F26CCC7